MEFLSTVFNSNLNCNTFPHHLFFSRGEHHGYLGTAMLKWYRKEVTVWGLKQARYKEQDHRLEFLSSEFCSIACEPLTEDPLVGFL